MKKYFLLLAGFLLLTSQVSFAKDQPKISEAEVEQQKFHKASTQQSKVDEISMGNNIPDSGEIPVLEEQVHDANPGKLKHGKVKEIKKIMDDHWWE